MTLLYQPAATEDVEDVLDRYGESLADALSAAGRERALSETGLDDEDVRAIIERDLDAIGEIPVEEAANLQTLGDGDTEALRATIRDELLMSMTSAVLDVERLAGRVDADLTPKEIQAKVEGRHPMTLREYAALRVALAE